MYCLLISTPYSVMFVQLLAVAVVAALPSTSPNADQNPTIIAALGDSRFVPCLPYTASLPKVTSHCQFSVQNTARFAVSCNSGSSFRGTIAGCSAFCNELECMISCLKDAQSCCSQPVSRKLQLCESTDVDGLAT